MGKLILCAGKDAIHPYYFRSIDIFVSNMEELCYYLYHNAFAMREELFSADLARFIGQELGLVERAAYLKDLQDGHAGAKDLMVAIFCSTDYYGEQEIKAFLKEYDAFYQLSPAERRKKGADRLMRDGKEREAALIYHEILGSDEASKLPEKEYGNLLHNLAVTEMHGGMLQNAPERFREAYERNHNDESLKQYLMALKLAGQEELLERELNRYMPKREVIDQAAREIYLARNAAEQTREYMELEKMKEYHKSGRSKEYNQCQENLLETLKRRCRDGL